MAKTIPIHVAIIPDGNRRWAKQHSETDVAGHQAGTERFREISLHAADRGVKYLSAWGLSLENARKRSVTEMAGLMNIFRKEFKSLKTSDDIHSRHVHINVLGRWREKFPKFVTREVEEAIDATRDYKKYFLNFFLAYNGTDEMLQAVSNLISTYEVEMGRVTGKMLKQQLMTKDLPPVDLVIRTGGEPHLSAGFMMWDVADAELYFPDVFWPDFTPAEFDKALKFYSDRERRFGK